MNRRGSEATFVRDQMRISENELSDITRIAKVGSTTLNSTVHSSHTTRMSNNLNSLLKEQIRDAVATIYNSPAAEGNRYTTPEELSKALLDVLFPEEHEHNTEVTGVVKVPTVSDSDEGSTDSKKERKKRAPMSEEAKAAMTAKRAATIAAKKAAEGSNAAAAAAAPAVAEPKPEAKPEVKERKPRGPMSEEAKAAMAAKRKATLEAKKAAV